MKKILIIILAIFAGLASCENPRKSPDIDGVQRMSRDSLFVKWNKSTLNSLRNHVESSEDSHVKAMYKNRLDVFPLGVQITDENQVNISSIRYLFLAELENNSKMEKSLEYFIVEEMQSGEKEILKNYVLFMDILGVNSVDVYRLEKKKWRLVISSAKLDLSIDPNLLNHFDNSRNGFNAVDDVIITHVRGDQVNSEYFLYSLLSKESPFAEILKIRK